VARGTLQPIDLADIETGTVRLTMIRILDIFRAMYVCVCNAINAETIRTLATEGLSFDEIRALTNCAGNCGSCLEFAESLVEQSRHSVAVSMPVVLATG
jgi:bacterioferritin-associated ferredoxin